MTKSQTKVSDSAEAKRWLIVGAHKAGASEKHVAKISGLSTTAVRNILLNYKRTGTPSIPKKISNKVRQKLIVEYDENGEIINTDDEDVNEQENSDNDQEQDTQMKDNELHMITKGQSITKKNVHKNKLKKKRSSNLKKSSLTTKDIIRYAMDQMRISDLPCNETSPTRSSLSTTIVETSPSSSSRSCHYHALPSPINTTNTTTTENHSSLPAKLPPPSKFEQNIRGYELWTHEDDMVLLNHVLHHLHGGGWSELEIRFNGRHSARLCYARWRHLKSLLLKGITDKPHTPW